jgi:hypothetical protein
MRSAESCGVPIPGRGSRTRVGSPSNSKASATAARFIESNLKATCLRDDADDVRCDLFSHPNSLQQILYGQCSVGAEVLIVESFDGTVCIERNPTTKGQRRADLTEGGAEEPLAGRDCNPQSDDGVGKNDSLTAVSGSHGIDRQSTAGLSVSPQAKFHSHSPASLRDHVRQRINSLTVAFAWSWNACQFSSDRVWWRHEVV